MLDATIHYALRIHSHYAYIMRKHSLKICSRVNITRLTFVIYIHFKRSNIEVVAANFRNRDHREFRALR